MTSFIPAYQEKMSGQRFSSPEDAVEVFKIHVFAVSKSEWKKKHERQKYGYAKKWQTFQWNCQIARPETQRAILVFLI